MFSMHRFKLKKLVLSLATSMLVSLPVEAVEFNINIIDAKDRDNIDLSQFSQADYVAAGEYLSDITLNGRKITEPYLINFIEDATGQVSPCITRDIVKLFDLKPSIEQELSYSDDGKCVDLSGKEEIKVRFDKANQNILFSIPQAWLEYDDPDWVPPSQWDDGVAGFIFDYNLFLNYLSPKNTSDSFSSSSNGSAGINLGVWRFRADYQYQYNRSNGNTNEQFDWTQIYAFRALPTIGAKLLLGESYLKTDIFDSFRFIGASLFSDNRMLPPSLRGYAPQITGIAKTNATVIISQNGRILRQTKVAPGPFLIQDITEAIQGTLDVTVEEEDGSKVSYQITATTLPFLTRQGQLLYKFAFGKTDSFGHSNEVNPRFLSGEMSYGVLSNTSIFGGLIATIDNANYQAVNIGIGQNMNSLGAISFDITRTKARFDYVGTLSGNSYRLNYSKRFESTLSQLTFAGYKFSEKEFITMPQFIDGANGFLDSRRDKNVYTASFNQYINALDITMYLNASHHQYWDNETSTNFGMSISKIFTLGKIRNISATLSANRIKYQQTDDNQLYLSLSVPIEGGASVSYDMQYANGGKDLSQSATYYSENIDNSYWSLRAGGDKRQLGRVEPNISANYQHSTAYGQLNVNGSENVNQYRAIGASWYGSMTMTQNGAALHKNATNNEPRVMVDSDGVAGISINNNESMTNRFGLGVATSMNSFSNSDIYIDMNSLPDDVDIADNMINRTLTEGAIGYQKIKANQGRRLLAAIRLSDGKAPPLGTSVTEKETGREVGIIGDEGIVYLTGINSDNHYFINWNNGANQCQLNSTELTGNTSSKVLIPCR